MNIVAIDDEKLALQMLNAVTKKFNSVSVNKDCIDCDYYRFLQGDVSAVNSYHGEFMAQYSWSEFITGYLENR